MELTLKLSYTLLMVGCFLTMAGITVDTAKGYGSKWDRVVYTGLFTIAVGVLLGLMWAVITIWAM